MELPAAFLENIRYFDGGPEWLANRLEHLQAIQDCQERENGDGTGGRECQRTGPGLRDPRASRERCADCSSDRSMTLTSSGTIGKTALTWVAPPMWLGALSGVVVVFGFTVVHDVFISDIWFNVGPMLFAGALCGFCIVWSYRKGLADHSTAAWFRYAGLYAAEMIALGAVSLAVLRPRFTMAELMVADDAFDRLLPPSMPLMIGAMVVGTILVWLYCGRPWPTLAPIFVTQVLLVFFLGHQFAFLGLVESSSALLVVFSEFALFTVGLMAAFCLGVMWSTMALERLRTPS